MSSDTREIIVKGLAENMTVDELVEQRNNYKMMDKTEEVVNEEIAERSTCPKCGEEMMENTREEQFYCPLGHYSHEL